MRRAKSTIVWLVLLGLIVACTLSGCKGEEESSPEGGAATSQTDPNA